MTNNLVVFLKNPTVGKVKTRLGKETRHSFAVEVYQWLMDLTIHTASVANCQVHLFIDEIPQDREFLGSHALKLQIGKDLGEKMARAFGEVLPTGPTVLIGSDCPQMDAETIDAAFDALKEKDVVVGPAKDGGFYLLGLKDFEPGLFENIVWSESTVCQRLVENLKSGKKSFGALKVLSDIDCLEDFLKFEHQYLKYKQKQKSFAEATN